MLYMSHLDAKKKAVKEHKGKRPSSIHEVSKQIQKSIKWRGKVKKIHQVEQGALFQISLLFKSNVNVSRS